MKSRGRKSELKKLGSPKSYKRNLDTMKLLVGRADFQEIVRATRKYLKLPPAGLKDTTGFLDKLISETDKMLDSQTFIDQERSIQKKLKAGEIGLKMANKQSALLYEKLPSNYLKNYATFVIDKFKLPAHFQRSIEAYIVSGAINAPAYNFSGGLVSSKRERSQGKLTIEVYARLAPDELNALKHFIDWLGKKKLAQYRPLKNIDKSLAIEDWFANRKSDPEASSVADIAQEYFGSRKKTDQVRDTLRNLKELRKKRFGDVGKRDV